MRDLSNFSVITLRDSTGKAFEMGSCRVQLMCTKVGYCIINKFPLVHLFTDCTHALCVAHRVRDIIQSSDDSTGGCGRGSGYLNQVV